MSTKTLLLVYIHGFKGSDNTFEQFPDHFRALVQNALPKINVISVVYPKFDTVGDLRECVARFKEWLQNKVIDLEVSIGTPSPTVDPSVRVALIGHSMGGIVAAETLLSIVQDQPVPPTRVFSSTPPPGVGNNTTSQPDSKTTNLEVPPAESRASSAPPQDNARPPPTENPDDGDGFPTFLFPYIQAVIAFDTPYLGLHPGVIAHGAETHYNTASAAMNAYTQASQFFGGGGGSAPATPPPGKSVGALPAPNSSAWGKWGKYAMGAAAIAAAGGAVWTQREQITKGWAWAGSHLEFVGCLARGAELVQRLEAVAKLSENHAIGFVDFYTCLDKDKQGKTYYSEQLLGEERTFCVIPEEAQQTRGESPLKKRKTTSGAVQKKAKSKGAWVKCINEKAKSEIAAHVAMFTPQDNPDYYAMADRAKFALTKAVDKSWYESSERTAEQEKEKQKQPDGESIPA